MLEQRRHLRTLAGRLIEPRYRVSFPASDGTPSNSLSVRRAEARRIPGIREIAELHHAAMLLAKSAFLINFIAACMPPIGL